MDVYLLPQIGDEAVLQFTDPVSSTVFQTAQRKDQLRKLYQDLQEYLQIK